VLLQSEQVEKICKVLICNAEIVNRSSSMASVSAIGQNQWDYMSLGQKTGEVYGLGKTGDLSPEEQQKVEELNKIDRKVRAHETAHIAAGGQYVRGVATYTYETGPDGKQYAVGGEVSIDLSPVPGDPEATVRKMEKVEAAALAPADPSPEDRAVAAQAAREAAEAEQQERAEKSSEGQPGSKQPSALGYSKGGRSIDLSFAAPALSILA
jgi:hypothetical protein